MSDESLEQIERQIASVRAIGSPPELRGTVLASVERELRASRWDRRLARAAVLLLVVGVGMNVAIEVQSQKSGWHEFAKARGSESRPSVVETAVVVAEVTDAPTARLFARQQAAMSGRKLTDDEAAAIEAAVRRSAFRSASGNKG